MKQLDSLARRTLDTLPINIAVLDRDGVILFTNRAWREFGGAGPTQPGDMVGLNYFEATDTEGDDYASEALAGLRSVVEGEQDLFTLEYPCHSPDEKRWFLMRATPLAEGNRGSIVVAHIDITQRKLAELRAERRREELERLTARLHGLVGDVLEAVLQARSREEVETTVCDRLAAVEDYGAAWVGRTDLSTDRIVPASVAGVSLPEEASLSLSDETDPSVAAVSTGEPVVVTVEADADLPALHRDVLEGAGEIIALPLVYGETSYGVLTVYATEPDRFDEREQAVLAALARAASTAINAVEGRRILTTDSVVELELSIADEGLFYRDLAEDLDAKVTHEGTIDDDIGVRMLFVVDGTDAEALARTANAHRVIDDVTVLSSDEGTVVAEIHVGEPPVVAALADHGAETTAIVAEDGQAHLTVELPAGADARAVLDSLAERYPSVDLRARRERERSAQSREELVADIQERLTARQRLALQKAFLGGFFDWPRDTSGEELAESMDISPSTYHQHLRTAERKVLESLFED